MTDPMMPGPDLPEHDPLSEALVELNRPDAPRYLLASALVTLRAAQMLGREIDTNPAQDGGEGFGAQFDRHDRHRRLLDEAFQLTQVAKAAHEMQQAELTLHPLTDGSFDEPDTELRTVPPADLIRGEAPRALNGVRFEATVVGQYLGRVGGRHWVWTRAHGFLDVTHAHAVGVPDADNVAAASFTGSIKSVTGDQALCVTDAGDGVVLPRALMREFPDE